jgi:hypothetical protein
MGINNDALLCYGIEFSYDEVEKLKNYDDVKKLAEEIGTDFMPNLWEELGFISASYYFDSEEEDISYIIGKKITGDLTISDFVKEINESELILYLKKVCEQYDLEYKEPRIFCRPDIN